MPWEQRIDLTGQRFNKLTVLGYHSGKGASCKWLCRCECGTEKAVVAGNLKNGGTKSCGCHRRAVGLIMCKQVAKPNDLVGVIENFLTYISDAEPQLVGKDKLKRRMINVRCGCGNEIMIAAQSFTSRETKSCGCMKHAFRKRLDMIGQRFGRLLVLKQAEASGANKRWECICDCGKLTRPFAGALRNGRAQSCGCLARELSSERTPWNKGQKA